VQSATISANHGGNHCHHFAPLYRLAKILQYFLTFDMLWAEE
jgi:hypothetical protein